MTARPDASTPAIANPDTLSGFRVTLAHGDAVARMWGAVESGLSLRETARAISHGNGRPVSFETVRRSVALARATLRDWPVPAPWQETMPEALRETCLHNRVESPEDLAHLVFAETPPEWPSKTIAAAVEWLRRQAPALADCDPLADVERQLAVAAKAFTRARASLERSKDRRKSKCRCKLKP